MDNFWHINGGWLNMRYDSTGSEHEYFNGPVKDSAILSSYKTK